MAKTGTGYKFDTQRLLFAQQWKHKGTAPDLDLTLARDPEPWFDYVARAEPNLFDTLRAYVGSSRKSNSLAAR